MFGHLVLKIVKMKALSYNIHFLKSVAAVNMVLSQKLNVGIS